MKDLDFRVGDKVWDARLGNGYISQIDKTDTYSIIAKFNNNRTLTYLPNGKFSTRDLYRALYHGHDLKVVGKQISTKDVWVTFRQYIKKIRQ